MTPDTQAAEAQVRRKAVDFDELDLAVRREAINGMQALAIVRRDYDALRQQLEAAQARVRELAGLCSEARDAIRRVEHVWDGNEQGSLADVLRWDIGSALDAALKDQPHE